jgi:hypothetical protein
VSFHFSKPDKDRLHLTGVLNVLDGVVDTPGRILVMTTTNEAVATSGFDLMSPSTPSKPDKDRLRILNVLDGVVNTRGEFSS